MNANQAAAFVEAQTKMMTLDLLSMQSENDMRAIQGQSPANGPEQYKALYDKWEPVLGCNAIIKLYQESQ